MSNPRLAQNKKKSPSLERVRDVFAAIGRFLGRDPVSTFLLAASLIILVLFFSLLGSLSSEGSGQKVPLSTVNKLAEGELVRSATLLDYDHQIVVETDAGLQLYADYPSSDAATQQLFAELAKGGAKVSVDPQSGKSERVIVVQFLLPILLLVCLFSFFMRNAASDGSGGIGAFSAFRGKGKRKKKGQKAQITFDSVAGAGEALAELREIRDFLEDPSKYLTMGAAAPKGVLLVGPRPQAAAQPSLPTWPAPLPPESPTYPIPKPPSRSASIARSTSARRSVCRSCALLAPLPPEPSSGGCARRVDRSPRDPRSSTPGFSCSGSLIPIELSLASPSRVGRQSPTSVLPRQAIRISAVSATRKSMPLSRRCTVPLSGGR